MLAIYVRSSMCPEASPPGWARDAGPHEITQGFHGMFFASPTERDHAAQAAAMICMMGAPEAAQLSSGLHGMYQFLAAAQAGSIQSSGYWEASWSKGIEQMSVSGELNTANKEILEAFISRAGAKGCPTGAGPAEDLRALAYMFSDLTSKAAKTFRTGSGLAILRGSGRYAEALSSLPRVGAGLETGRRARQSTSRCTIAGQAAWSRIPANHPNLARLSQMSRHMEASSADLEALGCSASQIQLILAELETLALTPDVPTGPGPRWGDFHESDAQLDVRELAQALAEGQADDLPAQSQRVLHHLALELSGLQEEPDRGVKGHAEILAGLASDALAELLAGSATQADLDLLEGLGTMARSMSMFKDAVTIQSPSRGSFSGHRIYATGSLIAVSGRRIKLLMSAGEAKHLAFHLREYRNLVSYTSMLPPSFLPELQLEVLRQAISKAAQADCSEAARVPYKVKSLINAVKGRQMGSHLMDLQSYLAGHQEVLSYWGPAVAQLVAATGPDLHPSPALVGFSKSLKALGMAPLVHSRLVHTWLKLRTWAMRVQQADVDRVLGRMFATRLVAYRRRYGDAVHAMYEPTEKTPGSLLSVLRTDRILSEPLASLSTLKWRPLVSVPVAVFKRGDAQTVPRLNKPIREVHQMPKAFQMRELVFRLAEGADEAAAQAILDFIGTQPLADIEQKPDVGAIAAIHAMTTAQVLNTILTGKADNKERTRPIPTQEYIPKKAASSEEVITKLGQVDAALPGLLSIMDRTQTLDYFDDFYRYIEDQDAKAQRSKGAGDHTTAAGLPMDSVVVLSADVFTFGNTIAPEIQWGAAYAEACRRGESAPFLSLAHVASETWAVAEGPFLFSGRGTRLTEGQGKKNNLWGEYNEAINILAIHTLVDTMKAKLGKQGSWRIRTTAASTAIYSDNTNARVVVDLSALSVPEAKELLQDVRRTFAGAIQEEYRKVGQESNPEETELSPIGGELLGHQNIFGTTVPAGSRSIGGIGASQTTYLKDALENYQAADTAKGSSMSSGSHRLASQTLLYQDQCCQEARYHGSPQGLSMATSLIHHHSPGPGGGKGIASARMASSPGARVPDTALAQEVFVLYKTSPSREVRMTAQAWLSSVEVHDVRTPTKYLSRPSMMSTACRGAKNMLFLETFAAAAKRHGLHKAISGMPSVEDLEPLNEAIVETIAHAAVTSGVISVEVTDAITSICAPATAADLASRVSQGSSLPLLMNRSERAAVTGAAHAAAKGNLKGFQQMIATASATAQIPATFRRFLRQLYQARLGAIRAVSTCKTTPEGQLHRVNKAEAALLPPHRVLVVRVEPGDPVRIPLEDPARPGHWLARRRFLPPRHQADTAVPAGSSGKSAPVQDLSNYYPRVSGGLVDISRMTRGSPEWLSVATNVAAQYGHSPGYFLDCDRNVFADESPVRTASYIGSTSNDVAILMYLHQSLRPQFAGVDAYTDHTAVSINRSAIINQAKAELATEAEEWQDGPISWIDHHEGSEFFFTFSEDLYYSLDAHPCPPMLFHPSLFLTHIQTVQLAACVPRPPVVVNQPGSAHRPPGVLRRATLACRIMGASLAIGSAHSGASTREVLDSHLRQYDSALETAFGQTNRSHSWLSQLTGSLATIKIILDDYAECGMVGISSVLPSTTVSGLGAALSAALCRAAVTADTKLVGRAVRRACQERLICMSYRDLARRDDELGAHFLAWSFGDMIRHVRWSLEQLSLDSAADIARISRAVNASLGVPPGPGVRWRRIHHVVSRLRLGLPAGKVALGLVLAERLSAGGSAAALELRALRQGIREVRGVEALAQATAQKLLAAAAQSGTDQYVAIETLGRIATLDTKDPVASLGPLQRPAPYIRASMVRLTALLTYRLAAAESLDGLPPKKVAEVARLANDQAKRGAGRPIQLRETPVETILKASGVPAGLMISRVAWEGEAARACVHALACLATDDATCRHVAAEVPIESNSHAFLAGLTDTPTKAEWEVAMQYPHLQLAWTIFESKGWPQSI